MRVARPFLLCVALAFQATPLEMVYAVSSFQSR